MPRVLRPRVPPPTPPPPPLSASTDALSSPDDASSFYQDLVRFWAARRRQSASTTEMAGSAVSGEACDGSDKGVQGLLADVISRRGQFLRFQAAVQQQHEAIEQAAAAEREAWAQQQSERVSDNLAPLSAAYRQAEQALVQLYAEEARLSSIQQQKQQRAWSPRRQRAAMSQAEARCRDILSRCAVPTLRPPDLAVQAVAETSGVHSRQDHATSPHPMGGAADPATRTRSVGIQANISDLCGTDGPQGKHRFQDSLLALQNEASELRARLHAARHAGDAAQTALRFLCDAVSSESFASNPEPVDKVFAEERGLGANEWTRAAAAAYHIACERVATVLRAERVAHRTALQSMTRTHADELCRRDIAQDQAVERAREAERDSHRAATAELTAKLEAAEASATDARNALGQLRVSLQTEHAVAMEALGREHELAMADLREAADAKIAAFRRTYDDAVSDQSRGFAHREAMLREVHAAAEQERADVQQRYNDLVATLRREHENELVTLRASHDRTVALLRVELARAQACCPTEEDTARGTQATDPAVSQRTYFLDGAEAAPPVQTARRLQQRWQSMRQQRLERIRSAASVNASRDRSRSMGDVAREVSHRSIQNWDGQDEGE